MKQKKLCPQAFHTLLAGLLLPAAVCAVYIYGLLGGAIATDFRYDALHLITEAAKSFACCAVVATAFAYLLQRLYCERS